MNKGLGLGRGLDSLISKNPKIITTKKDNNKDGDTTKDGDVIVDTLSDNERERILYISPNKIMANALQPRKVFIDASLEGLANSIKEYGIIQPLVVRKDGQEYELIAGERRLRASKLIGLKEVPVIVREYSEQRKLEASLVENIQRENLNALDKAMAYRKLLDEFNMTVQQIADSMGKARSGVSNSLRILTLPKEIREAVGNGLLLERHAHILAGLESEAKQMNIFRKILDGKLSIAATIKEVFKAGGTKHARIKINYADQNREKKLRGFFGTKSVIKRTKNGGRVIIDFNNDDDLKDIMNKILK